MDMLVTRENMTRKKKWAAKHVCALKCSGEDNPVMSLSDLLIVALSLFFFNMFMCL